MQDVAKGRNLRKSVKKREKQGGLEVLNKVKMQMGSCQSQKRKCMIKDSDHSRSKQRRISNKTKGIKGVPAFKVIQPQSMQVYRDIFSYKSLLEWHSSCMQAQVNVLFLLWISSIKSNTNKCGERYLG